MNNKKKIHLPQKERTSLKKEITKQNQMSGENTENSLTVVAAKE